MEVKIESIRTIKPIYDGISPSDPAASQFIPLSIFDKISYNFHFAVIYAYRSPTLPNATIEYGLRRALSEYRELAGRLGENENGDPVIFLNDEGMKLVEASVDSKLDEVKLLQPSSDLHSLHPSLKGVEELMQVQLTRFNCGSLVVGFTTNHLVVDGHSISSFLINWGKASRRVAMDQLPLHDRNIFNPRKPPHSEFEHRGVEFESKKATKSYPDNDFEGDIVVHKFHFTMEFLSKLKAMASSSSNGKPYSTFESLVAHLWRAITKARGLGGSETTFSRISVNGRMRMKVPNEYFGNLVLWAYPKTTANDLLKEPLSYAAKVIHEGVEKVDNKYFQSFIDFAAHNLQEENLVPKVVSDVSSAYPNVGIDSWLRFPFNDLDFGSGAPFLFMPTYYPIDGVIFLWPSINGDGSIDAAVSLFKHHMATFIQIVYSI